MPKPKRHHHICRVDHAASRTHCWVVTIQCNGNITRHPFSDGIYGGKRKALQAAITWRDAMLDQLKPERDQRWLHNSTKLRCNNSSSMVGVGRYIARDVVRDQVVKRAFWLAFWQGEDGQRHSRKFSVKKYGEQRAKALACAARTEAIAERITLRAR